ncbi:MAG: TonB-dependent receptor [Longimonas sp.]|uniref:TonB-dependent receptor n=1 Tax=Longimonas sp. TaxID=2039626 RepID=UPI003976CFEE
MLSHYAVFLSLALLLVGGLLSAPAAYAQAPGALSGTVVHADNGTPLPDVNIILVGTDRGTATDTDGAFSLENVAPGTYTVRASAVGYEAAERSVTIEPDTQATLQIELDSAPMGLDQVDVTATPLEARLTTSIGPEELEAQPLQDLGDGLSTVPGINLQRRGGLGLDPNVRGLTGTQVSTFVDGMRSFGGGPARMDTPLSHVDPASMQRMDVVRGPYALAQGPSLSTLHVDTQPSIPNTPLTGTLRTGLTSNRDALNIDGRVLGRTGRLFYDVNAAYRTGNDYTAGDGTTVRGEFSSAEARGRVGVALNDASRLSAQVSFQDQGNIAYPGRPLDAVYFETLRGTLNYEWMGTGTLQQVEAQGYAYQTLHRMNNDNKITAQSPMALYLTNDTEIATVGGRITAALNLAPDFTLDVGSSGYSAYRTAERERGPRADDGSQGPVMHRDIVWPDVRTTEIGGFAKLERVFGRAQATATGRLDAVHTNPQRITDGFRTRAESATGRAAAADLAETDVLWSAAASATVPVVDPLSLTAGLGSSARAPEPLERYGDRMSATRTQRGNEFMGNPTLNPERTYQADLGLDMETPRVSSSLTGFVRHHKDYITIVEAPGVESALPLTPDMVFTYANGEALFWGAEATAAAQVHPTLRLRASGEYLWGRDASFADDEPAYGVAPAEARLGARWMPGPRSLFVDASLRAVAEQDRVSARRNEGQTDGFTTVDLTAGVQLLGNIAVRVGGTNIFDTNYREHLNARAFRFDALQAEEDQMFVPEPGRSIFVRVQYAF